MRYRKKRLVVVVLGMLLFVCLLNWHPDKYIFYNNSSSIPKGIYYRVDDYDIQKGDIVVFVPPDDVLKIARDRGYMASETNTMMKYVAATAGDDFLIGPDNKFYSAGICYGEVAEKDSSGRSLLAYKEKKFRVRENEFVAVGTHPRSFDSRYWGPADKSRIVAKVRPLYVFAADDEE